ncbi:uracil-DNA glycosylase family protein [Microvirga arabica]|uniref:uracil-DNA glycosylase family protein n=1 Tax=Microvirga arabica TaxID=1128671 RepID=UPI0024846BC4|nr:uracil-DNA glycosylase family protein [Microvirga arabica]
MALPFHDFYTEILEGYHGAKVRNEPGCRPRGTFTRAKPGSLKWMFVLQNPGDPVAKEKSLEAGATPRQLVERLWMLSGEILERDSPFSDTLSTARIEACRLSRLSPLELTRHAIFTNLVRCTTFKKVGQNAEKPNAEAIELGANWLKREIAFWQPQIIIAYGSVARDGMTKYNIPFDDDLPHPTAQGKWLNQNLRRLRIEEVHERLKALKKL